jgi:tripartite-type tricarboxylate transporter receptor subunit TctC
MMQCTSHLARISILIAGMFAAGVSAQEYPARPLRVVVPWPAGGLVDVAARLVNERIQAAIGQPLVVDNKPGAGGVIGAEQVAKAAADGYTLVFTTSALNMNAALRSKMPFEVSLDFEPVAVVAYAPAILVVRTGLGVKTVKELISLAKAGPGKLTYASAGQGTPAHLAAELFKSMLELDIVHVPYKGAPPAMLDQVAGRVDIQFANPAVALPQIRAGKLLALAVTSGKRFAPIPDIPTMIEAGVPAFEADQWLGYLAPRDTSRAVIERLAGEVAKALAREDVRAVLVQNGMVAAGALSPAEFGAYLRQDRAKWVRVVKSANIQPE